MDWFGDKDTRKNDGPVISMTERQLRSKFAPLNQIEGYWNSLRGNRMMPLRSEIDPRGLKGALEYCFVLERIAPGLARLRVAGSHLGDLMGMEVRGMPISSFLSSNSRKEFGEALEEVFERPCTATIELVAETSFGRPDLRARIILLPVRSDLGDASRILGGLITDGNIGRVPRRFTVESINLQTINGREDPEQARKKLLHGEDLRSARPAPKPEFKPMRDTVPAVAAEDSNQFEQAIPGVPYLRVVK